MENVSIKDILDSADKDKMERILESSLEIFARDGYEKASTNEIVMKAGISKGLLFHYFGSKRNLWIFLNDFVCEHIVEKIRDNIDWNESDLLNRARDITELKVVAMKDYPGILEFMRRSLSEKDQYLVNKLKDGDILEMMEKVYVYNIDFSLFREDIDRSIIMDLIRFSFEGFSEKIRNMEDLTLDVMREKLGEYLDALRKAYYR